MTDTVSRTIVITGASDGIGAAAARRLSRAGHRVVVVGRTPAKLEAVTAELGVDSFVADFSRLSDVRDLAAALLATYPRIDVLANNAGGIVAERELTEDGHEVTFQVNHLAPFLLTQLLLDRLLASRGAVVTTASAASRAGRIDLDDPELHQRWSPFAAYSNSKLANIMFTRGLHRRYVLEGLSAAAFHPGVVATSFGSAAGGATQRFYGSALGRKVMLSADDGADTLVWLAEGTPPRDWASGWYYHKRLPKRPHPSVLDDRLVDAFWELSASLVR